MDDVKEFSDKYNVKMRILRVKRFIEQWNDMVDQGKNPAILTGMNSNFTKGAFGGSNKTVTDDDDNELFMGGIPTTMPEP